MANPLDGNFVHMVFFWLKNPDDPAARAQFLNEVKAYTSGIHVIRSMHLGVPAATNRDVIDNTYTFSMVTTFSNKTDQDIYQDHPLHNQFVSNAAHLWEKVVVYDAESF